MNHHDMKVIDIWPRFELLMFDLKNYEISYIY